MKTREFDANTLGLHAIRTIVLLMVFMGVTFLLSHTASSSVEQSMADYEQNADILKILHN